MNRVLVFLGEETLSADLTLMLRQVGAQATVARSPEGMLAALADSYDAIFATWKDFRDIPQLAESQARRVAVCERDSASHLEEALGRDVDDVLFEPIRPDELRIALRRPRVLGRRAIAPNAIVGIDGGLTRPWNTARKAAAFDTGILLTGESGTGKELFARSIHDLSPRNRGAFVAVNGSAIPTSLAESLLFGHEKGAFTGAHEATRGFFAKAHQGTLFLDEVGDFSADIQVKLLRVLQSGEVQRVGSDTSEPVDVRIIAATSRDLSAMIEAGTFREDLYYRLAIVPIELPPLRERGHDIGRLVDHFLDHFASRHERIDAVLSEEARRLLIEAPWPGNVRQLQNAIERLLVLSDGGRIDAALVRQEIRPLSTERDAGRPESHAASAVGKPLKEAMRDVEASLIREALGACGGKRAECARRLSISPRTLLYKLKEYGIS